MIRHEDARAFWISLAANVAVIAALVLLHRRVRVSV
jgi:hypothetical protein